MLNYKSMNLIVRISDNKNQNNTTNINHCNNRCQLEVLDVLREGMSRMCSYPKG